ncbi:MAG: S49 family peptidase [Pseudomonadota bacterium]
MSVIRLSGAIMSGGGGLSRATLNDAGTASLIEKAFKKGKPVAVAVVINSPGGSPTQSALIAARIRRLADETETPVHVFCEDVAASGGYWLATAGDDITVDANSVIGSIGVISSGFGFHELIGRYGIERRVHTAGESKSWLDPFKPEQAEDVTRLKALQTDIHDNFKAQVRARRGDRIDEAATPELFTGEVWVGQKAVDVGLADHVGHLVPRMKELYGDKVRFAASTPRRSMFQRLGAPGVEEISAALEERSLRARFGL